MKKSEMIEVLNKVEGDPEIKVGTMVDDETIEVSNVKIVTSTTKGSIVIHPHKLLEGKLSPSQKVDKVFNLIKELTEAAVEKITSGGPEGISMALDTLDAITKIESICLPVVHHFLMVLDCEGCPTIEGCKARANFKEEYGV